LEVPAVNRLLRWLTTASRLGGYADATVEELRCEVIAVRPDDRVQLRIEPDEPEEGRVPQRPEDRPVQLVREDSAARSASRPDSAPAPHARRHQGRNRLTTIAAVYVAELRIGRHQHAVGVDLGEPYETSVGEIHRDVFVASHQGLDGGGLALQSERRSEVLSLGHLKHIDRATGSASQQIRSLREDRFAG